MDKRQYSDAIRREAVTGPISNDNISSRSSGRNPVSEGKSASQQQATSRETAQTDENTARSDTVNVSRAGEILNKDTESVRASSGAVTTPEQAVSLVATIREQIETAGAQALTAQGGIQADQFSIVMATSA